MKIVIIGAGSLSFGWSQLVDLLSEEDLKGRDVKLTLVDENAEALDRMTRFAEFIRKANDADAKIEAVADRCEALVGADYVICAVARKRYELWEQDYRVPLSYGFRHCLGENGGPGALFHALRSIELVLPICRDMERLCPDAIFLNFTNPEARVLHAILHLTKIKAYGLCHGVFAAMRQVANYTERPVSDFKFTSGGMNHLYMLLSVEDLKTGKDILPDLKAQALADETAPPLWRKLIRVFDAFSYPSDDHIGEYLSYGWEDHGLRWHYGLESREVERNESPCEDATIEDYLEGRREADERITGGGREHAVPIICDIELNRGNWREAVNVLNTEGYVENLPREAAVEVPAIVDAQGVHPQHVGALPEAFAAVIRRQCDLISLLTEAYRTRDRNVLLQALLMDPCVNSLDNAEKLIDTMFTLQKDFLPEFK